MIGQKAKLNAVTPDAITLNTYAGIYEDRKITLENGSLYYQRIGAKFKLLPVTQTIFVPQGMDDFRLEFVVKDGKAVQVNGMYSSGEVEPSKRKNQFLRTVTFSDSARSLYVCLCRGAIYRALVMLR